MTHLRRPARTRRAFTLLEILIVLGLILILASLVLGVGSALLKNAERSQLDSAMVAVESAISEWEAQVGRPLSYVSRGDPLFGTEQLVQRFDLRDADAGLPVQSVASRAFPPPPPPPPTLTPSQLNAYEQIARARGVGVYCVALLAGTDFTKGLIATVSTSLLRREQGATNPWPTAIQGYRPSFRSQGSPRPEFVDPWGNRIAFVFPGRQFRWGVDTGRPDDDGTIRTPVEQVLGSCVNRRPCLVSAGPDGQFGPESANAAAADDNVALYPLAPVTGN